MASEATDEKQTEQKTASKDEIIDIIDTHIHLWNKGTPQFLRQFVSSKLNSEAYDINTYYKMYNNQTNPYINLKHGIFMETVAAEPDINTEINEITTICKNPNNNLKAMIIQMDPNKPEKQFLQTLNELKQNPYIVGIRKVLIDSGFHNDQIPKQFIDNLQILNNDSDVNWTFDIAINIELLSTVEVMIKAIPSQIFILDHMGNHHEMCGDDNLKKIWRQEMEKLSKYKNVCVKLSGMSGGQPGLKAIGKWSFDVEKETIDFVVKHFDENNIVYGCDWPVSLVPLWKDKADDFLKLWTLNLYNHLKTNYGKEFCDKVFVKNAVRIYNLKL